MHLLLAHSEVTSLEAVNRPVKPQVQVPPWVNVLPKLVREPPLQLREPCPCHFRKGVVLVVVACVKPKDVFGEEIGRVCWIRLACIWAEADTVVLCNGLAMESNVPPRGVERCGPVDAKCTQARSVIKLNHAHQEGQLQKLGELKKEKKTKKRTKEEGPAGKGVPDAKEHGLVPGQVDTKHDEDACCDQPEHVLRELHLVFVVLRVV